MNHFFTFLSCLFLLGLLGLISCEQLDASWVKGEGIKSEETWYDYYKIGSSHYDLAEYDSAVIFYDKSLEKLHEDDFYEIVILNFEKSSCYGKLSDFEKIRTYANGALEAAEKDESGFSKEFIPLLYSMIAQSYLSQGEYKTSIPFFQQGISSLTFNGLLSDTLIHDMIQAQIGMAYFKIEDHKNSVAYLTKALTRKIKDLDLKTYACLEGTIALSYLELDKEQEAINHFKLSNTIFTDIQDWHSLAFGYNMIGRIYRKKGDYRNAIINYNSGLIIAKDNSFHNEIMMSSYNLGLCYLQISEYTEAIRYFESTVETAQPNQNKEVFYLGSAFLSAALVKEGNHSEASDILDRIKIVDIEPIDDKIKHLTLELIQSLYSQINKKEIAYDVFKKAHELGQKISEESLIVEKNALRKQFEESLSITLEFQKKKYEELLEDKEEIENKKKELISSRNILVIISSIILFIFIGVIIRFSLFKKRQTEESEVLKDRHQKDLQQVLNEKESIEEHYQEKIDQLEYENGLPQNQAKMEFSIEPITPRGKNKMTFLKLRYGDVLFIRRDKGTSNTEVVLKDGQRLKVRKSINSFEEQFPYPLFNRVHQSYLINGLEVSSVGNKYKGGKAFKNLKIGGIDIRIPERKQPEIHNWLRGIRTSSR